MGIVIGSGIFASPGFVVEGVGSVGVSSHLRRHSGDLPPLLSPTVSPLKEEPGGPLVPAHGVKVCEHRMLITLIIRAKLHQ